MEQGKAREALELLDRALKQDPRCAEAYATRGMLWAGAGEGARAQNAPDADSYYKQALSDLGSATRLNPKLTGAWINLGNCHYRLGNYKTAVADFSGALKADPRAVQAYRSRAAAYSKLNDDKSAIGDLTRAYQISHDASLLFVRGNAYLRLGKKDQARADYEEVVRNSKDPTAVAGARNNLEAIRSGNSARPDTAPNRPNR